MNKYFLIFQFLIITGSLIISVFMANKMLLYEDFNKTFFGECKEISICMVGMIISSFLLFLSQSGKICCNLLNDNVTSNCGCFDCIGLLLVLLINIWGWYINSYDYDCKNYFIENFNDLYNIFFGQLILFLFSIISICIFMIYKLFFKKNSENIQIDLQKNSRI